MRFNANKLNKMNIFQNARKQEMRMFTYNTKMKKSTISWQRKTGRLTDDCNFSSNASNKYEQGSLHEG